jgi:hypothetical protein
VRNATALLREAGEALEWEQRMGGFLREAAFSPPGTESH